MVKKSLQKINNFSSIAKNCSYFVKKYIRYTSFITLINNNYSFSTKVYKKTLKKMYYPIFINFYLL